MNWKGDNKLTRWFVLAVFFWGVIVGEILPVSLQKLEQGQPGAKQALFTDWGNALGTCTVYFALGWLFWFLYRKLHWLVVVILAAILGVAMEFSFMRPQEDMGPNVVEDPLGAMLFFVVVWPILLGAPFAIYRIYQRLIRRYPALKPFVLIPAAVLAVISFGYAYLFQR